MRNFYFAFFTVLFIVVSSQNSIAQQINPKIQEVYGNMTEQIAQNEPDRIKALNDLLENRIKIIESPAISEDKYIKLSTVTLLNKYNPSLSRDTVFDTLNFNPLKYNFNFFSKTASVYRVDNTNYLIIIEPQTLTKD
jgi:hypothetical protein